MKVPSGLEAVLSINEEVMHGELCFTGTRVPLAVFLDNMADRMTVSEFLTHYPSVSETQVQAVLLWEHEQLRQAAGLDKAG